MSIYTYEGIEKTAKPENIWSGKIASFLGDSITQGVNTTKTYHDYLKEIIGFSTCNNYGINASSIADGSNPMCNRYTSIDANSDIVFVFGGTNDFHFNTPLGEWYTESDGARSYITTSNTFRGALNKLCLGLKNNFPTKQIVLMTPLHRGLLGSQKTDMQTNSIGLYFDQYVECVREASEIFAVNLIDLYRDSGLFPYNDNMATEYFHTNDKLHPNAKGHERIAQVIADKLITIPYTSNG